MTTLHAHDQTHAHGHGAADHHGDHPPFLKHHWDTPKQQFEAGKLGMWLFLATEVLLFGGLFCAYSVWRGNHPELFQYGSHYLNTTLGATNTAVLILSSLTMAWGVTAAQQNKQGLLKIMLLLTLAGAATFLVIKYFEYTHKFHEGLYPGIKFYEEPEHSDLWVGPRSGHQSADAGAGAEPGTLATPEHASAGAADTSTAAPAEHALPGGEAQHAPSVAVAIGPAPPAATAASTAPAATGPAATTAPAATTGPAGLPPVEASTVALAASGPPGLAGDVSLKEPRLEIIRDRLEAHIQPLQDPDRPRNLHMFFNIYYMMTGLHGIHVVIGMIVIIWLLIETMKGRFSSEYFTPVDLGGLYWHVVDLIWIFLFPLFYLI